MLERHPHDDRALAAAGAMGDGAALRAILERTTGKLRAIAWHMVYDSHECQDLCQEALLKITSPGVLDRYAGHGPLDAYLIRVGVRTMISARRGRSARQWQSFAALAPEHGGGAEDPPAGLDGALREALAALPERARTIVLLLAVGDYSYEETAEIVGLPVGTVKSAYHRARVTLRSALAGWPAPVAGGEAAA